MFVLMTMELEVPHRGVCSALSSTLCIHATAQLPIQPLQLSNLQMSSVIGHHHWSLKNDEKAYREEVQNIIEWPVTNHLDLDIWLWISDGAENIQCYSGCRFSNTLASTFMDTWTIYNFLF